MPDGNEIKTEEVTSPQEPGKAEAAAQPVSQVSADSEKRIAELEASVKEKDEALNKAVAQIDGNEQGIASLNAAYQAAVGAYREQIVKANPLLPPELILGNSVDDINKAADKAAALVDKVRKDLASQAPLVQIPAGAPGRTPPDLSCLSPRDKIKHGLFNK
jgi:hypothetical protein